MRRCGLDGPLQEVRGGYSLVRHQSDAQQAFQDLLVQRVLRSTGKEIGQTRVYLASLVQITGSVFP